MAVVVMKADATRGVAAEVSIGAERDSVLAIGLSILLAGALIARGAVVAIGYAARAQGVSA